MESLAPGTIEPSTLSPVTANGLQEKRRFNANGEPEAAAVGVNGIEKVVRAEEDIVGHDWSKAAKTKYLAAQSTVLEYLLTGPLVVNIKALFCRYRTCTSFPWNQATTRAVRDALAEMPCFNLLVVAYDFTEPVCNTKLTRSTIGHINEIAPKESSCALLAVGVSTSAYKYTECATGAESQTSGVVARHASATFGNELDQLFLHGNLRHGD
ncbi:hypothetical protein N5P37_007778 [Trichoderma harzianum]|nr:hypothetical protein N5P37_007778 [Trichoderma harzianum]